MKTIIVLICCLPKYEYPSKNTNSVGNHWDFFIPSIQLIINCRINKRLNSSAFSLMFARRVNDIKDIKQKNDRHRKIPLMTNDQLLARTDFMSEIVVPAICDRTNAQVELAQQRFNNAHKLIVFKPNQYVMIRIPSQAKSTNGQLSAAYSGPYQVVLQIRNGGYVLRDQTGVLMPRDYPAEELKPVSKEDLVELNGSSKEKSYEVEAIIDHRGEGKTTEYLVRWKNYSSDWDDWIPADNFNDFEVARKYWSRLGLGVPYTPKKNNIVTNAPISNDESDSTASPIVDPDAKSRMGYVAQVCESIKDDLDELSNLIGNNSSVDEQSSSSSDISNNEPISDRTSLNSTTNTKATKKLTKIPKITNPAKETDPTTPSRKRKRYFSSAFQIRRSTRFKRPHNKN